MVNWLISIVNELKELGFHEVVLTDFRFPDSDMYRYNGTEEDKTAALVSAANSIATQCTTSRFCVSFAVSDPTFTLPEGRTRIYLENVDASAAAGKAADNNEFALVNGKVYIAEGRFVADGIIEAEIFYFNCFHFKSSLI